MLRAVMCRTVSLARSSEFLKSCRGCEVAGQPAEPADKNSMNAFQGIIVLASLYTKIDSAIHICWETAMKYLL